MFSSSRAIASGFGLALALSFAVAGNPLAAQATPQDTTHKGMKMPMNMPMGKKPQKKKTTAKPATTKKAEPHHAPAKAGQMQMPDTTHAMHGDSAHRAMPGMKMPTTPSKTDSMKMPGMPGMEMPSNP